jgi:hypothetical protein
MLERKEEHLLKYTRLYTHKMYLVNGSFNFFFYTPSTKPMNNPKYEKSPHCLMRWVASELEHVGRIVAMKDARLQKSYAMSTVNGMAHLKDALYEAVQDPENARERTNLLRAHDAVIRTMKHLISDFNVSVNAIEAFNTEHVLSNLSYLKNTNTKTRRNRKSTRKH